MTTQQEIAANSVAATKGHALVAGGGTGGHVFPGLAVVKELAHRGWQVSWAGAASSMEEKLCKKYGVDFYSVPARPLVGRGPLGQAMALATLSRSAWSARKIIRRLGVQAVLGTGGYVSAGAVLGGRLAGVPVLLLEPNAEAGVANRMLSRFAVEAFVAFEGEQRLSCPVRVCGVPVRPEFFDIAPQLPFGAPLKLLVLGGSQGSRQLNELLPAAIALLPESLGRVVVRHQSGGRHQKSLRKAYEDQELPVVPVDGGGWRPDGPRIQIETPAFISHMASAMAESHLILSRAGAITLAEICAAGRPSLLLPLEAAGGHQKRNAERLVLAQAALMLGSADTPEALALLLGDLLADRERLTAMADAARSLGRADAAKTIADRIEFWAASHGGEG